MNGKARIWALMVGLMAVAFAAGWLVAKVQDVDKVDFSDVVANRWMGNLGLLIDNSRDLRPVDPVRTQLIVRLGLDTDSLRLAQRYDGLSPALQKRLAFYIPMARAVVALESKGEAYGEQGWILIFVDCMQQVRVHGGSVHKCFEDHRGAKQGPPRR